MRRLMAGFYYFNRKKWLKWLILQGFKGCFYSKNGDFL